MSTYVVLVATEDGRAKVVYHAVSRWEAQMISSSIPGSWITNA